MKKTLLSIIALIGLGSVMLITSCSKDDATAPVVTVTGDDVVISLNSSYTDAGATATDDEDGTVTVTNDASTTNPDVNTAGIYTITYSASDKAGNIGTATRSVTVKNDAAYLEGTYTCSEDGFVNNWTQTVTADKTHNNRIIFQYFADYVTNPLSPQIYAQVTGSAVELATAQNAVGGTNGCTHTFTPNGTATIPIALVSGKYNFSIKFTDQEQVGGGACTGSGAVAYEDVCHQQ